MALKRKWAQSPVFAMLFCVLYLFGVQFSRSLYEVKKIVVHGKGYQFSVIFDTIYLLALWLPFMLIILNCVLKKKWKVIFKTSKKVIQEHWKKYIAYLILVFLILKSVGLGDMQYDIAITHTLVDLSPSFKSYVVMQLLYHVFRSTNSVLFLIFAPIMYCIEFEILGCFAENLTVPE